MKLWFFLKFVTPPPPPPQSDGGKNGGSWETKNQPIFYLGLSMTTPTSKWPKQIKSNINKKLNSQWMMHIYVWRQEKKKYEQTDGRN